MNYLSGALRYVAGGDSDPQFVIPRLVDRLKTSVLPADRRAAIQQLAEAAKQSTENQQQAGDLGLKAIYAVLEQDGEYDETITSALELLLAICNKRKLAANTQISPPANSETSKAFIADVASHNVHAFLKITNSTQLLCQLLTKNDFYIKLTIIELFNSMANTARSELQAALLSSAQGVTNVCDLLDDSHRLIRSNAVLLLSAICEQSTEICKIVAFAGVLEKLFIILESLTSNFPVDDFSHDVRDEHNLEAAIIVQDVLLVVRNLVVGTPTTKTFMRDSACVPRLINIVEHVAIESNLSGMKRDSSPVPTATAGVTDAVARQARKSFVLALDCISGLVEGNDEESTLIKIDIGSSNVFRTIVNVSFTLPSTTVTPSDSLFMVRLSALKTVAMLVRGHDEFRKMFSSSAYSVSSGDETISPQIAALRTMMFDQSAAIRLAAYTLLRYSFVVDSGLDLPSSALLNAMTSSTGTAALIEETKSLSRTSLPSPGYLSAQNNAMAYTSDMLKQALVGWPELADPAGVFYAASLVSWLVSRVQGARERLLGSYVNGSSLLPQIIRTIGKLEREKGPPEVRISLFSLACVWLYDSPSAVSAFLSSAMHLPMLIDTIQKTGSRGDIADIHTRGLAAVLLGICLQATEGMSDLSNDGGFMSGGGPSTVLPRGTVANVIQNRIGITVFTTCLDDLRATKSCSAGNKYAVPWEFVYSLMNQEENSGFFSVSGDLGHDYWYDDECLRVVNNIYDQIGAKALDLVAEPKESTRMNGLLKGPFSNSNDVNTIVDSTRDEVLTSYKEFIRSQDESLNSANAEIESLKNGLREAQNELDSNAKQMSTVKESEQHRNILKKKEIVISENRTLQALLAERESELSALSEAYDTLEEEQGNNNVSALESKEGVLADMESLRNQYKYLRDTLESEVQKSSELSNRALLLDSVVKEKEMELRALEDEQNLSRSGMSPSIVEALQWKTRAEVAESKLQLSKNNFETTGRKAADLEGRLRVSELTRSEAVSSVSSIERQYENMSTELQKLRSERRQEVKSSRESSVVVNASSRQEITALRQQLAEVKEELNRERDKSRSKELGELQPQHDQLLALHDQLKAEMRDTRRAVAEWQKRAQASESLKGHQSSEISRLTEKAKELAGQVESLKDALQSQTDASNVTSTQVAELQQQCTEIDEMRRRTEEKSSALEEQLASRTEQSIRLSGQLYEIEEEKNALEEKNQSLVANLVSLGENEQESKTRTQQVASVEKADGELHGITVSLREELELVKDALSDSKDRESLARAKANDRDTISAKCDSLERSFEEKNTQIDELKQEMRYFEERLMLLDEAEESKRMLTMEVVSLRAALSEAEKVNDVPAKEAAPASTANSKHMGEEISRLQSMCNEKESRIVSYTEAIENAKKQIATSANENDDLQKQVRESETVLSVVQMERDQLSKEVDEMKCSIEANAFSVDADSRIASLERQLEQSEQKRDDTSTELSSLVQACKLAEKESCEIRHKIESTEKNLTARETTVSCLQNRLCQESARRQVEGVVLELVLNVSLAVEYSQWQELLSSGIDERENIRRENNKLLEDIKTYSSVYEDIRNVRAERDEAFTTCADREDKLRNLSSEIAGLQLAVKERDELKTALEAAEKFEMTLRAEKDSIITRFSELQARFTGSTDDSQSPKAVSPSSAEASQRRLAGLEEALRDAARTVADTNLELIAAQGLLVELSSDKSMMHAELMAARGKIEDFARQVNLHGQPLTQGSAMSEISDPDHGVSDVLVDSHAVDEALELSQKKLKSANAEAENLRTALSQSISEAESAASLITSLYESVGNVETRMNECHYSLAQSQSAEDRLKKDFSELEQRIEEEKTSNVREIEILASDLDDAIRCKEEAVTSLEQKIEEEKERNAKERELLASKLNDIVVSREKSMTSLEQKLEDERKFNVIEKERLLTKLKDAIRSKEEAMGCLEKKLFTLERSAKMDEQTLQAIISAEKQQVEQEKTAKAKTVKELSKALLAISQLDVKIKELEAADLELTSSLNNAKVEIADLEEAEQAGKQREMDLKSAAEQSHRTLQDATSNFDQERKHLEEQRRNEVKEYEYEIGVLSKELESAEREVRNSESLLKRTVNSEALTKRTVKNLENGNREMESLLDRRTTDLANEKMSNTELSSELSVLADTLREAKEKSENEILALTAERDEMKRSIEKSKAQRKILQKTLDGVRVELDEKNEFIRIETEARRTAEEENRSNHASITSLRAQREMLERNISDLTNRVDVAEADLKEETECKEILERENSDFLSTIESLESTSKRLRDEVSLGTRRLKAANEHIQALQDAIDRNEEQIRKLEETVDDNGKNIQMLQTSKITLKGTIEDLKSSLSIVETDRDALQQDNQDLREWVSDLENQARELQDAIVNFEDVERSLRETLELQQQTAEEKNAVSKELKEEKDCMSRLNTKLEHANREKQAAQSARDSSQRRAEELESRIRGIREEHLKIFSSSEAGIRRKAQRCAELESELASCERKLAELASVSDEIFGVKTTLRQAESDLETLRQRAETAEKRAEELVVEVSMLEGANRELQESECGKPLKGLQEEHNELLVYLADLELEVTSLREELGRE